MLDNLGSTPAVCHVSRPSGVITAALRSQGVKQWPHETCIRWMDSPLGGNSLNQHIGGSFIEWMSQCHIFDDWAIRWIATLRATCTGGSFIEPLQNLHRHWLIHSMNEPPICKFDELPPLWVLDELPLWWIAASMNCRFDDCHLTVKNNRISKQFIFKEYEIFTKHTGHKLNAHKPETLWW